MHVYIAYWSTPYYFLVRIKKLNVQFVKIFSFAEQCRVSDYGFGKLAELFEAVSDTVSLIHQSTPGALDNKIIRLTPKEQIKVWFRNKPIN